MLKKASATVDLISQKVKAKGMIQESVTSSFATNVIELTSDAVKTIAKQDIMPGSDVMNSELNINIRFIKPSRSFYNGVMSSWLKFLKVLEEEEGQQDMQQVLATFIQYAKAQQVKSNQWQEDLDKPLEIFSDILSKEYLNLKGRSDDG